jgi:hypothetical protein
MILIPKYNNVIQLDGSLSLVKMNDEGKVTQEIYVPNTVVALGKNYIAKRMHQDSANVAFMRHMGIGTSDAADTDSLAAEVALTGYSRVAMSVTASTGDRVTTTPTGNTIEYVATFGTTNPNTDANGVALKEAGIFDASSAGVMLCRTTFPVVTKVQGDTITITWTITIG